MVIKREPNRHVQMDNTMDRSENISSPCILLNMRCILTSTYSLNRDIIQVVIRKGTCYGHVKTVLSI